MPLANFYKLPIVGLSKETADAVKISFKIPRELANSFTHLPGQYLTLRIRRDGEELRRCYSICSAPGEELISIAVKKVAGGRFSIWANQQLSVGDELEVMPPDGRFIHSCPASSAQHYLCVAAGSGITPIISIIKTILETEPISKVTLVFGNQKVSTILFLQALESLKNQFMGRVQIIHILSQESREASILNGRIDAEKLLSFSPCLFQLDTITKSYICGPEPMIKDVSKALRTAGKDPSNIYYELFGSSTNGTEEDPAGSIDDTAADRVKKNAVTLIVDGRQVSLEMPPEGKSILDAALDEDLDLPYACKGGVCGTCRAKVVKGKVRMDSQSALSISDIENGAVLTCRAHPITDEVSINFDKAL
jgi:ring-1,2-phenylacetyl-CoA epoxidase subunit PaaE